jgi:hypothetical protein
LLLATQVVDVLFKTTSLTRSLLSLVPRTREIPTTTSIATSTTAATTTTTTTVEYEYS